MGSNFINTILLVFAGLFPIVNPLGGAPIFLSITRGATEGERAAIARSIAINGFFVMLGSMFVGSHVLEFFGITIPVVRIAGGLIVSAFAWQLLHSGAGVDDAPPDAAAKPRRPVSVSDAFYPLTLPLTFGPGSIAVAITIGSQLPRSANIPEVVTLGVAAIIGIIAMCATVYICYRYAERIAAFLGDTGVSVLVRLMAFILLCIGIQIIWSGWSTLTPAT